MSRASYFQQSEDGIVIVHRRMRVAAAKDNTPLHHAADQHTAALSVAVRYAFAKGRALIGTKDANVVANAVKKALLDVLPGTLLKVMTSGGETALKAVKPKLKVAEVTVLAGPVKIRFDNTNPAAKQWAKDHATELATDLSITTRERVRNALEDLFDGEATLDDVRDAVGDDIRADIIARTEAMTAVNEGQRQGWDQAVEQGLLDENAKRTWIATFGCCDECDELDGTETTLDGDYPDPGGDGPPLHPNCRCTEGISG